MNDLSNVWIELLRGILNGGAVVAPRGMPTKELLQHTIKVSMDRPVLTVPSRKLGYHFMAAEAYWILTGDNRVSTIAPYSKNISRFSDDGVTFFGAYGPRITAQLPYVVEKLVEDRSTRQAGLTIWRENPPKTKDMPCTISIFFNIRGSGLNVHVFMRSSDVWLGIPYDVFTFSMLGWIVCGCLNCNEAFDSFITPNHLYLTAISSHLYETNWDAAEKCVVEGPETQAQVPLNYLNDPNALLATLKSLREPGSIGWWWSAF